MPLQIFVKKVPSPQSRLPNDPARILVLKLTKEIDYASTKL